MTWGMHAIGYIEANQLATAAANFNRSFANSQAPFGVWTETPTGGTTNFLTGIGGFLQTVLFGYPGVRLNTTLAVAPVLLEFASSVRLRGIHFVYGSVFQLDYDARTVTFTLVVPPTTGKLLLTDLTAGSTAPFTDVLSYPYGHKFSIASPQ